MPISKDNKKNSKLSGKKYNTRNDKKENKLKKNEDSDNAFYFLNLGAETSKDRLTREQIYFQIAELSYDKKI